MEAAPQSHGQRSQSSESSDNPLSLVVGFKSKEPIYKDEAVRRVRDVLRGVDGFVRICDDQMPLIPKVVLCEFASPEQLQTFLRNQKSHHGFDDFWASPNRSFVDRSIDRPLFQIKRAICEITGCDGASVLIDKPKRKIYRLRDGKLIEICYAPLQSLIVWHEDVTPDIKERAIALMAAR